MIDAFPIPIRPRARTALEAVDVLPSRMSRWAHERFLVVALNNRNEVLGVQTVARGTIGQCPVDPREVFRFAVLKRAAALIVAHNHPSGDPEPSVADLSLTRRLADGARLLGLQVLDHIIVARGGRWLSLAERGLLAGEREEAAP